jgi:hypothetical protein
MDRFSSRETPTLPPLRRPRALASPFFGAFQILLNTTIGFGVLGIAYCFISGTLRCDYPGLLDW